MTKMNGNEIFPLDKPSQKENKSLESSEPRKKWWKRRTVIAGLVLILVVGFLLTRNEREEQTEEESVVARRVSVIRIGDDQTLFASLEKTLKTFSGREAEVIAEATGRLGEVNFEVGDLVQEGQILAKFEQNETQNIPLIDLNSAKDNLNFTKENLEKVEDSTEEEIKIAKNSVEIAKEDLEDAKAGVAGAPSKNTAEELLEQAQRQRDRTEILAEQQREAGENAVDTARANYKRALSVYENTLIKAPAAGVIVKKNVDRNSFLNTGTVVAEISSNNDLKSTVYLSQEEVRGLKKGDKVEILCNGEKANAGIESISSVANGSNLRYGLSIGFTAPEAQRCVSANKFVSVIFKIPASSAFGVTGEDVKEAFFLPLSAVEIGQTKTIVFVVENKTAKTREVEIGNVFGEFVEITQGLNEGEVVASAGSKNLKDGDLVEF